ncbi:LuxR C-terminal-related transcriptional regulator [Nocardia sp. NPDC101769]|uniref:helix-turn-helix transcriptional regulator n=1 Tax=Nocardia sp. NPDC101769 TaxID=3364333 RepID=UPI0037F6D5C6
MSELFESLSAALLGTAEDALTVTRRHLDAIVAAGPQWALSWARFARAIAVSAHGDPTAGLALCDSALAWQIPMRDHWGGVWGLSIRARILSRLITSRPTGGFDDQAVRQALEVARLIGNAAAIRRRLGIELTNLRPVAKQADDAIDVATKVLGHTVFEAAMREGEFRPGADQIPSALHSAEAGRTRVVAVIGESRPWDGLTHAEQEVALLAAAGLTNTMIAERRGTSSRTVDAQVASVLSKLMIGSRKDIIPLLPTEHPDQAGR